jgi:hypothetical protein
MTTGEIAYLGLVIFAFTAFAVVLAWMSRTCNGSDRSEKRE